MTQTSVRWIATGLVILVMSLTLEAAKRPSIGVSPKGATLQSGQTLQFTATILRSTGTPVWSAMGGTITTTGLYTAGSVAGSFTVRATISGTTISSATTVTITVPAPVAEICGNGIDDDLDGLIDEGCSSPSPATTGVQIAPGQSIQAAIDANPSGTTFTLLAGTHPLLTAIKPKSDDSLVGQAGTVLSGARLLTSFSQNGSYWTATGQTQQGPRTAYGAAPECQTSYPRCGYPEDLFFDGAPLRHVDALSKLVTGTWFFDYAADIIYFVNDPTGHTVETSVTTYALIGSGQTAVKLRNLVIEKFANPAQIGAVNADGATGWLVDGCTFQLNHGTGLSFTSSSGVTISNNRFTMQGQLGIGTYDTDTFLVVNNEIDHNNFAGFDTSWEAGGTKFVWS